MFNPKFAATPGTFISSGVQATQLSSETFLSSSWISVITVAFVVCDNIVPSGFVTVVVVVPSLFVVTAVVVPLLFIVVLVTVPSGFITVVDGFVCVVSLFTTPPLF